MQLPKRNMVQMVLFFFLLARIELHTAGYIISPNKTDWYNARYLCKSKYSGVLPSDGSGQDILKMINKTSMPTSVWLGIRGEALSGPEWVTGESVGVNVIYESKQDIQCGYMVTKNKLLRMSKCFTAASSVLCQNKACAGCGKLIPQAQCIRFEDACYFYFTQVHNWYEGRNICLSYRGDMAVLNNEHLLGKVAERIFAQQRYYTKFWIGIQNYNWQYTDRNGKAHAPVIYTKWSSKQPGISGICVHSKIGDGWYTDSCMQKHSVFCTTEKDQSYQKNEGTPLSTLTSEVDFIDKKESNIIIYSISLTAILVCFFIALFSCIAHIFICCYKTMKETCQEADKKKLQGLSTPKQKRKKRSTKSRPIESAEPGVQEMIMKLLIAQQHESDSGLDAKDIEDRGDSSHAESNDESF